jgi:hypothetical protein
MKKLPTAEEYSKSRGLLRSSIISSEGEITNYDVMIEFAKLHVEAALKNAYDCHRFKGWTNSEDENVHKELFVKNIMSRQSIL